MRYLRKWLLPTASGLLVSCLPGSIFAQVVNGAGPTSTDSSNVLISASNAGAFKDGVAGLPDSPGAVRTQSQSSSVAQGSSAELSSSRKSSSQSEQSSTQQPATPATQEASTPASQSQAPANPPTQPPQPQSEQQALPPDAKPQQPAGTAAAEAPVVSGSPVAEPAGVAIAPAKQHRTRTIVIRVGAILGAGAALGTVLALTEGTSSRPPGAR